MFEEEPDFISEDGWLIELYIKVHFSESIESPVYGFLIKTTDGVSVYGTNSLMRNKKMRAVAKDENVIIRFKQAVPLIEGDYFINVGIGAGVRNENVFPLDRRLSMIHLKIISEKQYAFNGFFDLETVLDEVKHENEQEPI